MNTYARFCVVLACLVLLLCLLAACAADGEPEAYLPAEHTHTYGYWYDAAPEEGDTAPRQVRYCRICHAEEVRVKE